MSEISRHISLSEATYSDKAKRLGISNIPDSATIERMKLVANEVFEPLRVFFNIPIGITSFYRSAEVNKAIGGASNSQHVTGEAMDIDADKFGGITNGKIFNFIKANLEFDQLIWEFGNDTDPDWVHVSYKASGNRKQILRAKKANGKTFYDKIV